MKTSPSTPFRWAIGLVLGSALLALGTAEFVARLLTSPHPWRWENQVLSQLAFFQGTSLGIHDPMLGWVPRPGLRGVYDRWGVEVSTDARGLRTHGGSGSGTPWLAVGDSFTFGDEVADTDSWPAQLERLSGRPVVNGGVFGYGLDQIVLRTERLLEAGFQGKLLVSFIPDDITRTAYDRFSRGAKPYFTAESGKLVLHQVPVPHPDSYQGETLSPLARRWGYSALIHWLMMRLHPEGWMAGAVSRVHQQETDVSCLLMERLGRLAKGQQITTTVIAQPTALPPDRDQLTSVLNCAVRAGLDVVDLHRNLETTLERRSHSMEELFRGHMTPTGNRWVAEQIFRALTKAPATGVPSE